MDKDAEIARLRAALEQAEKVAADYKRDAELAQANERVALSAQKVSADHNTELQIKIARLEQELSSKGQSVP